MLINANATPPLRRIRSFVKRDSRMTAAQRNAVACLWTTYGLSLDIGRINFSTVFEREAPCFLEIGFGSGTSLIAAAKHAPNYDFIGIETHQPGIGSLLMQLKEHNLSNVRVYYADANDVLEHCIPDQCLAGIQLFFPDPWPKRKHFKRRLIQPLFIKKLAAKLAQHGILHLATDWQDYANHMMHVLSLETSLKNTAGPFLFANRSQQRPLVTKFENRGLQAGRMIYELQFSRL